MAEEGGWEECVGSLISCRMRHVSTLSGPRWFAYLHSIGVRSVCLRVLVSAYAYVPPADGLSLLFCSVVVLYIGPVFVDACVSVRLHVPPGFVVGCPIVACVLHILFVRFFVV